MSKYERFEMRTVKRSELKGADFNPRTISKQAKARLRKGIEETGLVQPLVWTQRTGRLFGGHQRLSILDDLEGSENNQVQVAVVDVDDIREKKLNVLLNNDSTMGSWDERKLLDLLAADGDINYESYGFSAMQGEYFNNLMAQADEDNAGVVAALNEAVDFETEVQVTAEENSAARHAAKIERKRVFEEKVHSLLVPQDESAWKLKTDEEKKTYDAARTGYREERFNYTYVKIAFTSLDAKVAFLRRLNLPDHLEVIHESDIAADPGAQDRVSVEAEGGERHGAADSGDAS